MPRTAFYAILLAIAASRAAAAYDLPLCDDRLVAAAEADAVTVTHMAAEYNCCPYAFAFDVSLGEGRIDITETEVLVPPICTCTCCWDLSVLVSDVPSGDWMVHLTYWDYEAGQLLELTAPVHVEEGGQGVVAVADSWDSGCLQPGTAAPEGAEESTWGRVKSQYR